MDFESAVNILRNGGKIRRQKWNEGALNKAWLEISGNGIDFKAYIKLIGIKREKLCTLKHYSNLDSVFSFNDVTAIDWEEYTK